MTWIMTSPPRLASSRSARYSTAPPGVGLEPTSARPVDERGIDLDTACVDAELAQQLEELASPESDVEHGRATHESGREVAVAVGDVVGVAAEVRIERVGGVPRFDPGSGHAGRDLGDPRQQHLQPGLLLGELELEVVELLENVRVVRVGEHVRRPRHQCDRANYSVRLILSLLEHALDLAAHALGHDPVHFRPARNPARQADRVTPVLETPEVSTASSSSARTNAGVGGTIAHETLEVPVEVGLETRRVLPGAAALLHPLAQRAEQLLEIRGVLVGRGCRLLVGHAPNVPWRVPRNRMLVRIRLGHGRIAKSAP